MAKDDEKKEEAAEAKGGSKKMIVLVVPVLLLVVGAGYFLFLKPKGGAAEPAALPAPKPGAVVALTETTVNLADSHYLKFNMTLQPTASAKAVDGSKAMDLAINEFSGLSMQQLSSAKGRNAAQEQLIARVKLSYLPEGKKSDAELERLGITLDPAKETTGDSAGSTASKSPKSTSKASDAKKSETLSTPADLTGAEAIKKAADLQVQTQVYDIYFTEWVMQ